MKVRSLLTFMVGALIIGGFLAQMWELFDQFLSKLQTVAVSYGKKENMKFPSFAFCDSRAFRKRMSPTANAEHYNATAFNMKEDISQVAISGRKDNKLDDKESTHHTKLVPTMFNGYCMLYEFHRYYPMHITMGKYYSLKLLL